MSGIAIFPCPTHGCVHDPDHPMFEDEAECARRYMGGLLDDPAYVAAFRRMASGDELTDTDRTWLAIGRRGDAYRVPPQLDPTVKP